jgi:branched-chain amino acid transport system ATP-binding protein
MLEIRDLHVTYGGIPALHGISITVPAGSIVTLIGANGAGKSSTLRAVSGIATVSQGSITFEGRDITRLKPEEAAVLALLQRRLRKELERRDTAGQLRRSVAALDGTRPA